MRRQMFVLGVMLTAVATTASTAWAETTSVTERIVTTVDNPCNGEVVLVEGTVHYVSRANEDRGGGGHSFTHGVFHGTGTGLTSGDEYRVLSVGLDPGESNYGVDRAGQSYNQNLWIDHPFEGAAYLPR